MSTCTATTALQYTLTDDGVLTIHTEKEGEITTFDLLESTKYKHLIISGKTNSLDMHILQLFATHCVSIDLTDTQVQFNRIKAQNFMDFEYLEEFRCPKTITLIEFQAFNNCPNLKTVVLPKTLKEVDYETFQNCPKLEVKIPSNVKIGKRAFRDSKVTIIDPIPEPEPEVPSCRFCSWLLDWMRFDSGYDKKKNV